MTASSHTSLESISEELKGVRLVANARLTRLRAIRQEAKHLEELLALDRREIGRIRQTRHRLIKARKS